MELNNEIQPVLHRGVTTCHMVSPGVLELHLLLFG